LTGGETGTGQLHIVVGRESAPIPRRRLRGADWCLCRL